MNQGQSTRGAGSDLPGAARRFGPLAAGLGLVALVLATRAPFLASGWGSDDDALRNALAAFRTLETGRYEPSRVPGFPLLDGVLVLLAPLGAPAVTAAAILAQAAAVLLAWRLGAATGVARPLAPAIGLALAPAPWTAGTQAMDYAFGLACVLSGALALARRRPWLAGFAIGAACGFRASHALLVVPGVAMLFAARAGGRAALAFVGAAAATALLAYLPVLSQPATRDLGRHVAEHVGAHHATAADLPALLRGSAVFLFGKLGVLGLAAAGVAIALAAGRAGRAAAPRGARGWTPFEVFVAVAVAALAAFYLLIPYESAYLLPLLPLVLVAVARRLPAAAIALLAAAIALESFALPLVAERRVVPGRVAIELAGRRALAARADAIRAELREPGRVLLVSHAEAMRLALAAPGLDRLPPVWRPFGGEGLAVRDPASGSAVASALDAAQRDSLLRAGFRIVAAGERGGTGAGER